MKMLTKEHGTAFLQGLESSWDIGPGSYGNWIQLQPNAFASKNYFDLAGLSLEKKSLFFEAAGVQTANAPFITGGAAGDTVTITDIMSSSPLRDTELLLFVAYGNFAQPNSRLNFDETVYARNQVWALTLNEVAAGYMVLLNENQFGSMSPTASDRVYSYRVIAAKGVTGVPSMDSIYIYPSRHILRAEAKEEPDHEYIMRLLRSYQLQEGLDED